MGDFTQAYSGIAHFGIWASESMDDYGRRDALARLASAVEQTMDRCLPGDRDTLEALRRFRKALDEPEAIKRRQAAADAYKAICKAVVAGQ